MSKKILIFGNGISLKYAKGEYDYKSLATKFAEGLETSIKYKILNSEQVLKYPDFKYGNILNLSTDNFNEGFFFVIYKNLVEIMFEHQFGMINNYKLYSYKNTEEIWKNIYDIVKKDASEAYINYLSRPFREAHTVMIYSISRAVSIDIHNDAWIDIKYDKAFLENILIYDEVYTTNYYVGKLTTKKDINYLHGRVLPKGKGFKELNSEIIHRAKTIGQEFEIYANNNILFGETYEDKVFLNSIINWRNDELKRVSPTQNFDFKESEVDIVGLSTEGDKDLITNIITDAKNINIYYHTEKDRIDWKKVIDGKQNCNLIQDTEYIGFINETIK